LTGGALAATAVASVFAVLAPAAGAATITVTTITDEAGASADCALREAVQAAADNADLGGCDTGTEVIGAYGTGSDRDTIVLGPQSYELDVVASNENLNGGGDIDTHVGGGGPLTIRGAGQTATTVRTELTERIFDVATAGELRLEQLTVSNGDSNTVGSAPGGNVRAAQPDSTLALERVTVTRGFGISGGGISIAGAGSQLFVIDSLIFNNISGSSGGGVNVGNASAEITLSRFVTNKAIDDDPGSQATGGGISLGGVSAGSLTVSDSEFVGNQATATDPTTAANGFVVGGAINHGGDEVMVIRRSLFEGNFVETNSTDEREAGGAIHTSGNETNRIVNSTFEGNRAGDAATPEGTGGAIHRNAAAVSSRLTISHTTMRDNEAVGPGADQIQHDEFADGTLALESSILTRGTPGDTCQGNPVVSSGYNAADPDPDCGFVATDSLDGGPIGLAPGPPSANGGPTRTIALDPSGRAVNLVPPSVCASAEGTDQRGTARPIGLSCDAGAYEAALPSCNGVTATLVGTEGADKLSGTPGADVIVALGGKDTVRGLAGKDRLCGGAGKDRLVGGGGKDRLLGEGGKDRLRGGRGKDVCKGGPARDRAAGCERERSI
jgi:CSLREA domain-containing protein